MIELAEIVRRYGPAYLEKFGEQILPSQRAVLKAIEQCRTEALGGHVYYCPTCEETCYSYHSCRNRHCPKCQHDAAQAWLEQQRDLLLPVPYFLVTFTLPAGLRGVARRHQQVIYDLLFRTSAEALQQLALDPRFVGGRIGLVGVLQTWTRDLRYHPHVHFLVPGGGLAAEGKTWRRAKNHFFVHVKPLARLFRAKFRDVLRKTELFAQVSSATWSQDWVVDCRPVGTGETALKYLAPYIFRVALSNRRILKLENDQVTFTYKDGDSGKTKHCTLPAEAFLQRFLQHVLPKGFVKSRYYGLFSAGNRPLLQRVRTLLASVAPTLPTLPSLLPTTPASPAQAQAVTCPKCGQPMQWRHALSPRSRAPPQAQCPTSPSSDPATASP
jgi:hypothetical protein